MKCGNKKCDGWGEHHIDNCKVGRSMATTTCAQFKHLKEKKDGGSKVPCCAGVIKPCGCGSKKLEISVNDGNYATYNVWVRCLDCGDVGPSKKTVEECIEAWDEQDSQQGGNKKMAKYLEYDCGIEGIPEQDSPPNGNDIYKQGICSE